MSFSVEINSERNHYRVEVTIPFLGRVFRLQLDAPDTVPAATPVYVETQPELGSTEPPRADVTDRAGDGLKRFSLKAKPGSQEPEALTQEERDVIYRSFRDRPGVSKALLDDLLDAAAPSSKDVLRDLYFETSTRGKCSRDASLVPSVVCRVMVSALAAKRRRLKISRSCLAAKTCARHVIRWT